jgi:hypothetical protein
MIVAKAIKPGRFRSEAFTQAITAAAKQAGNEIEKDFQATTKTWKHKVDFVKEIDIGVSPVQVLVGTDDEIYRYVDEGTKEHPIFAGIYTGKSDKKALVFPWGGKGSYKAKTTPGVIGSQAGGSSGPIVAFPFVQHPGTKARNFDETIRKKWEPKFKRLMEQAFKTGARNSGHSI